MNASETSPQPLATDEAAGALTLAATRWHRLHPHRLADGYLVLLALVLLGYALLGRGFAYLGLPPLFIGELMLALGIGLLICTRKAWTAIQLGPALVLVGFIGWGVACTVPYLGDYGMDALRDAMLWAYALYALVLASLLIADPARLARLVGMYRWFVVLLLALSPLVWLVHNLFQSYLPTWPWAPGMPVLWFKGGDHAVHLAGAFVYLAVFGVGGAVLPWLVYPLLTINMGIAFVGRAATLTLGAGVSVVTLLRPRNPLSWGVVFALVMFLTLLWATDLRFAVPASGRDVSFDQFVANITSMIDESEGALQGTKQWRLNWWTTIIDYTIHGEYFWSGKGFGINLADDDGFQADADGAIRSPHNGHLAVLARMGVPGLALWLAVHGLWTWAILDAIYRSGKTRMRARIRARAEGLAVPLRVDRWFGVFVFLFAYYLAFLVNASFDVFLEGPMGGIWFWTIYGVGLAAVWIHRHCPEALDPADPHENSVRS